MESHDEQIEIMENIIHDQHPEFSMLDKLVYIKGVFVPDPAFSVKAINHVIFDISRYSRKV